MLYQYLTKTLKDTMETKDNKFTTVHDDFFGNVVGTIVQTIKNVAPKPATDYVAEWSIGVGNE